MASLYARAVAAALPGSSLLTFLRGEQGEIPDVRLELDGVRVQAVKLATYEAVCEFRPSKHLPATYPHILAFPLQLAALSDPRSPFGPIGLVHIENRILQHKAIPRQEQLDLCVHCSSAEAHPRGSTFALRSEARIAGEKVWEGVSTMLHRGASVESTGTRADTRKPDTDPFEDPDAATISSWALASDLGRRYGAVSGDRNPIHMHPLSAKAFGFEGAIAHGMWSKARALAALAQELPEAYGVHVLFRKPIVLPANVEFAHSGDASAIEFAVRDATRHTPHLHGRTWPLQAQRAGAIPGAKSEGRGA